MYRTTPAVYTPATQQNRRQIPVGGQQQQAYSAHQPVHHGDGIYNSNFVRSKPRRKYPKNFAEKRKTYVCPEKAKVEELEVLLYGMAGDIRKLRAHVVALSPPPRPAVEYDMQGFPIAPHPAENNAMIHPVHPRM